ncbi:MAG: hypothetical protein K6G52_08330, partial [Treponemataceae bacterium]|nr:hypothetical protein [Treponemataceae bacterium]
TEKAFVLSGSTCAPLANNGNVTFTLWVEDSLGLPSAEKTFTVAMENVDEVSPVGQLLEFNTKAYEAFADYAVDQNEDGDVDDEDWAVYQLSSLNSGSWDKTIGHIEPRNTLTSTYATVNPTLSGKVWIRGQVLDNQKIVSIKLNIDGTTYTVAEWDSTAKKLVAAANVNGTTELHQIQDQEGHFAEFAYLWDTSSISAVAKVGTTIKLLVTDASDRTSTAGSYTSSENTSRTTRNRFSFESWGYAQTDVDVRPYITRIDTALSNASSGAPSTFNRSASGRFPVRQGETITVHGFNLDSDSATINGTSVTPTTVSGERVLRYTVPSSNSVALTLKLGEVEAVNNINDNTKAYNLDKNNVTTGISAASNNDNLTDDRVLQIWKFTTVVSDTTIRYPTMRVGKDSNQTVGFAYDSGAQSYKMYLSSTLAGNSDFVTDYSFSQWYDTSVAIDTNGKIYGVSQNGDSGGTGEMSNDGRANSYFYAWNTKNDPDTVRIYHSSGWNSGYRDSSPNGSSYAAYSKGKKKRAIENAYNGSTFNSQRVVNPKIATGDDGVYLVYYDSSSDQVRFRYGTVTGSAYDSGFTGGLVNHDNSNYGSAENYQVVAGNTSSSTPTNNGDIKNNVGKAGEYVAVGVVPKEKTGTEKDVAVVAWYDASNTQLLFSYNTNATDTNNAAQWGTNTMPIDSNFAGWYVDMAVDAAGGIHIAYYGASSGDLRYAYLEDYDDDTPTVVTVDSYLSVGTNISIDVSSEAKTVSKPDGTTKSMYIPYISYYMSAFTKTSFSNRVAWLEKLDANGLPADGVSSEKFIGNWEVATIPTSQVPLDYSVGVGIKNNGTVNAPILGYGTKTGLETAQLMDSE